jgi:hypothetical protein
MTIDMSELDTRMKDWAEAFTAAQAELPPIGKRHEATIPTKTGGGYSYKYADLNDVLEAVRPVLNKHGLSISQSTVSEEGRIGVVTRIYHTSGHVETFGPLLLPAGGDARSAGSAITYARRYGLCAALGIAPDDDDDGAAAEPPAEVTRTDVEVSPGDWLKTSVEAFGLWTPEQRREAYQKAMTGLEFKKLSSMDRAKEVFEKMSEAYYEDHPETGLF